jgi:O-antigen/teichoic acid export membrane protein
VGILAVGAAYLGVPFIRLWVGEQYVAAAWITPLLCMFQLIWQSNAILGPIYNASGRALKLSLIALGSAAANVGLSLWLVRDHGVQGVLLATMIAGALTVPVQYLLIFPVLGLEPRRYLLESVVRGQAPSLLVGALLWPLSATLMGISSWWALLAAGAALGAALLGATWALGLDGEQRGWLSARVRGKLGALRR